MKAYGEVAVEAVELLRGRAYTHPRDAWTAAARAIFPHSRSLQDKACPRGAFLGLCSAGLVRGVPKGEYSRRPTSNGRYAVDAVQLLWANRELVDEGPEGLWLRVMDSVEKRSNSQMDVVLALWDKGIIDHAAKVISR